MISSIIFPSSWCVCVVCVAVRMKALEALGAERLRLALEVRGLKTGGSAGQRAQRLWLFKEKYDCDINKTPAKLKALPRSKGNAPQKAKLGNNQPETGTANPRARKFEHGPLLPGLERKPGQKSLPGIFSCPLLLRLPLSCSVMLKSLYSLKSMKKNYNV
jgi:hypothetical protein